MNTNDLIMILSIVLGIMVFILIALCIIFVLLKSKNKTKKEKTKEVIQSPKTKIAREYTKESVFNFMEFDKIEDNMIVQKNGARYLMVIECQGINYDLMSGVEKNSVEAGFVQFLNTLRKPIQIYVQTRTVNLSSSIGTYQQRVDAIREELNKKQLEYEQKQRSGMYTPTQLSKLRFELVKQRNLCEYGIDIVKNTEQMSLNRNILSKKYYIIIPYYSEELGKSDFDKEEIKNVAFSELYTNARAMMSSLSACEVNSKILDSNELIELLYMAYNRDEAEVYGLDKAIAARYDELYSTAPDVLDKRMIELDKKIEQEAIEKANQAIMESIVENEKARQVRERENEIDELIAQMAEAIIEDNKQLIGEEVAEESKKKVRTTKKATSKTKDKEVK